MCIMDCLNFVEVLSEQFLTVVFEKWLFAISLHFSSVLHKQPIDLCVCVCVHMSFVRSTISLIMWLILM